MANKGYLTILFSKLVGPNGKAFAFEPDLINVNNSNKNITADKSLSKNIYVEDLLLWNKI